MCLFLTDLSSQDLCCHLLAIHHTYTVMTYVPEKRATFTHRHTKHNIGANNKIIFAKKHDKPMGMAPKTNHRKFQLCKLLCPLGDEHLPDIF